MNSYDLYKHNEKSPLAKDTFIYIESSEVSEISYNEWAILKSQRNQIDIEVRYHNILAMLKAQEIGKGWGYTIDPFRHALQTATMAAEAGNTDEVIIAALLHDIVLVSCPENHGVFAASMVSQFLPEDVIWVIQHHQDFIGTHELKRFHDLSITDPRKKWEEHNHYDLAAYFVDKFDVKANSYKIPTAPVSYFEPILYRVITAGLSR